MSALVTGASGGLGAGIALALAEAGRDIGVHYRGDASGAADTVIRVESAGRRAVALHADLDIEGAADLDRACEDLLDRCTAAVGPVDAVVLNAFPQDLLAWTDLDTHAWDAMHRAGLRPTTALLQRALARLEPGGVVVVVGSVEALRPAPMHAPYAVAKAALHHLTAAAAQEVGALGVRVVGVAPGLVERVGLREAWPSGVARWEAASALRRPVTVEEVAATVAFLASPAASGITGTTLPIDAGWSAGPGW